jgi:hypothetical protein
MHKIFLRLIFLSATFCLLAVPARADWFAHPLQAYQLGDPPYWPGGHNWEPAVASGCWKWNWQQRSWYDHCPAYVHPKAFMYSRGTSRVVLHTKY